MLRDLGSEVDLCLEFTNTYCWRGRESPSEYLPDPGVLSRWLQKVGLLDEGTELQQEHLTRAKTLREAIYAILQAKSAGDQPKQQALDTLQTEVAKATANLKLTMEEGSFGFSLPKVKDFETAMNGLAISAADLLVSVDEGRIRVCANEECGWAFIDNSKNRSRRWCSMSECGNVAKARRYYEKKRKK